MTTYISMLRGINVSGQKKVDMKDLKALYEALNFRNVRTYIQSGNVVFDSPATQPEHLSGLIEKKIAEQYAFEVPVIVKTADEMEATIAGNLLLQRENIEQDKLHVTFLWQAPAEEHIAKLKGINFEPDKFLISAKVVYIFCPNGYGRTKLTNTFFESKLEVKATTRNWRTVNELLKIAR